MPCMKNRTITHNQVLADAQFEAELLRASKKLYAIHAEIQDQIEQAKFRETHPAYVPDRSKSAPIKKPQKTLKHIHAASGQSYFAPKQKLSAVEKANSTPASNPSDSMSSPSPLDGIIGTPHPRFANKK